jgi:hypothetical protein
MELLNKIYEFIYYFFDLMSFRTKPSYTILTDIEEEETEIEPYKLNIFIERC